MAPSQDSFQRLKDALAGSYALEEAIGRGGMATVYRAEDLRHRRKVAVKVLDPELAAVIGPERFLREIETAANLSHPHILPLYDSGEAGGFLFFVMPFVKGESLRDLLDRERQLPVADAIRYAKEIGDALAFAHSEGVVHRDVKPANILLEAGHAILADFGIAQAAAQAADTRLTQAGTSLGSPAYMSPEQVAGEATLDARSDQYALGCVLYEMLVGQPPFSGASAAQVVARQLSAPVPEIAPVRPSVDPRLDRVVARAMEKLPADRYPSLREFNAALEGLGAAPPGPAPPPTRDAPGWGGKRLRWLVSTTSLALLVLAGGFLFLGSTNDFGFQRRDWILLTDFQNGTGEEVFDRSLDNALAVGLQQSNHLNVFPETRISQTLQRMLRNDTGEMDEDLAREVALRENIHILVVPSIDRVDRTYVLAIRIVDPSTGESLLSRSVQAEGANEVLPALDRLAHRLRRDLGESRFSIIRQDVPLLAATTPSLQALQAWSQGSFLSGQRRYDEALTLIRRAVELDSAFAMAHADLGGVYYYLGDREQGDRHFREALDLTDRVTERERLWIQAEVQNWRENYEGAIDAYNVYLAQYPDDLDGWFRLGYALMRERRSGEASLAFERVVEMDPENAAGFINLATCHNQEHRLEQAVEHYLRAFELAPAWLTSGNLNHEFGFTYVRLGRMEDAEEVFLKMLDGSADQEALGHRSLGLMKMYLGRYREAREDLRQAALLHQTLGSGLSEMRNRQYLAVALLANGSAADARQQLDRALILSESAAVAPSWLAHIGKALARQGRVAEAEEVLGEAEERANEEIQADRAALALLRGEIAVASENPETGIQDLRTALALREDANHLESLAHGLAEAGSTAEATELYRSFLSHPEIGWEAQEYWLRAHLDLGRLLEAGGEESEALEYYERLLDLWAGADPDLEILQAVRERVEFLT